MADPSDLKFFADDVKLVEYYLRNRVSTGESNFITDINLYGEEPWLLPHVYHSQFHNKEWFYFVTRNLRAGTTPNRTVPGRGGSEGGTWTTNGKKKILDNNDILIGYKSELSYHKRINVKTKYNTTGSCVTEYSLASPYNEDLFQEVVLCHIREKKGIAEQYRYRPQINFDSIDDILDEQQPLILPQDMNPPLHQDQESDQEMDEFTDALEHMLEVDDDDEATQQQQQQQDAQIRHLPELGQDSRSRNSQLVVFLEDEYVDQDFVFDLHDQTKSVGQSNHNFEDIARGQEMSPTVTNNNPYGYQMQEAAAITSGLNQDSSCSSATHEQGRKRRRMFDC